MWRFKALPSQAKLRHHSSAFARRNWSHLVNDNYPYKDMLNWQKESSLQRYLAVFKGTKWGHQTVHWQRFSYFHQSSGELSNKSKDGSVYKAFLAIFKSHSNWTTIFTRFKNQKKELFRNWLHLCWQIA